MYAFYVYAMAAFPINTLDSTYLESCLIVAAHFKILANRIETIEFDLDHFNKEVEKIIKYHDEIHDLAESLKNAYKLILFPYFSFASLFLCCIFFLLTVVSKA